MFELLQHDHEELSVMVDRLLAELGSNNSTSAFELLDLFWARLAMHIRAENLHLFPAILDASKSHNAAAVPRLDEVKVALDELKSDHNFFMDQLAKAIKTMRGLALTSEDPTYVAGSLAAVRDRVTAVTDRLVAHNELEERQVYKWPASLFSAPELERLSAAIKRELNNIPPRFEPT